MHKITQAVSIYTKRNNSNGEVTVSVGEGLLIVINACKTAKLDQSIIEQLKTLYLEGIKSATENDFITDIKELLADHKQIKVSKNPEIINADPTRRYFETHLANHLLRANAEELDTDNLRIFNINLKHNLWRALAQKPDDKIKLNFILKGVMAPSLNKYQLEYAELIKKLSSHNFHGLTAKACDNLAEIAKMTIIATMNTEHDKSMPADIYSDSVFTMGMDGRGRMIKKTNEAVLTGFKGLMQSITPVPVGDLARDNDTEQFQTPLYEQEIDEHDRLVRDKNKNINLIPVTTINEDGMGETQKIPVHVTRERMRASPFQRSADQAKFMMESQWCQHLFSRQTQIYSNGISSTTLATLRNILMQKREGNPFHEHYFEKLMASFAALMLYNSGGHSLFEIFEVFKLPQLSEIMEESGYSQIVRRDELMQQWLIKDNPEQFNKAIDETLLYMEQLINRRILNAQLKSWAISDGTLKSVKTEMEHDVRAQLVIENASVEKTKKLSLHKAILTLESEEFLQRLNATKKVNLNVRNASAYTPLMVAAQIGKLEHVKALVKKGANRLAVQNQNMRALDVAIKAEQYAVVCYLLSITPQIRHKDFFIDNLKEKHPALYYACRQTDMRILQKVIQHDKTISIRSVILAIQETVKFENIEAALTVIGSLTPQKLNMLSTAERQKILNMAAQRGNIALLGNLLESKIAPLQAKIDYESMIIRASQRGYVPIVRLLLCEAFQMETLPQEHLLNNLLKSALTHQQYDLAVLFIIYGARIDTIGITDPNLEGFTEYLRTTPPEHFNAFFSNRDRDMIDQRAHVLKEKYKDRTTGVWRSFLDYLVMFLHQLPLVNLEGYYQKTEVLARLSFQVITNEQPKNDYEIGYGEPPKSDSPDLITELDRNRESLEKALEIINNFKVNYNKLNDSQEVDASRLAQIIKFETLIKQISPSLNKLNPLELSDSHPQIDDAITKKMNQLNQFAKRRKLELFDTSTPSTQEDALRYRLNKNDMDLLIAYKKEKHELNCHVVDGDHPCSITNFLENILKNGQPRTQLVYKIKGTEHWSVLDIQRKENGTLSIFFLDSIGHVTNLPPVVAFCTQHQVELTKAMGGLQKDNSSCSIFSIDHAFQMSRITDLHNQLSTLRKPSPNFKNTFEVNPMDLPPELVKNAQSSSYIKAYLEKHPGHSTTKINKKNQTLFAYAESHNVLLDEQKTYRAINYKQVQYRKKINKIKGYEENPQHQRAIIESAQRVLALATREIQNIKIDTQSTTLTGVTFYYQTLLQQIEEIRTSRAVRDAQTILNLRQTPVALAKIIRIKQNELLHAVYDKMTKQEPSKGLDSSVIKSAEAQALLNRCQTLITMNFNKYLTLFKRKTQLLDESTPDKTDVTLLKTKELCASLGQLKRDFLLEQLSSPIKPLKTNFIQQLRTILQKAQLSLSEYKEWDDVIKKCLHSTKAATTLVEQSLFAKPKDAVINPVDSESSAKRMSQ